LKANGSQSVTQDDIHIDEVLKLAATCTSGEIASLLNGTKRTRTSTFAAGGISSESKKGAPRRRGDIG
jgi:hypothetical protein